MPHDDAACSNERSAGSNERWCDVSLVCPMIWRQETAANDIGNVEKYTTKQILSKTYVAHLFHVWYQFQIRTVLSHEPVATAKPSGDTPSVRSFWSCPISSPVSSVFNVSNVYVTFGCIIGEWNSSE